MKMVLPEQYILPLVDQLHVHAHMYSTFCGVLSHVEHLVLRYSACAILISVVHAVFSHFNHIEHTELTLDLKAWSCPWRSLQNMRPMTSRYTCCACVCVDVHVFVLISEDGHMGVECV